MNFKKKPELQEEFPVAPWVSIWKSLVAIYWLRDHKYLVKFKLNFEYLAWACSCFNCQNKQLPERPFGFLANDLSEQSAHQCWAVPGVCSLICISRLAWERRQWSQYKPTFSLFLGIHLNFVPKSEFPWLRNCLFFKLSLLEFFAGESVLTVGMSNKHGKRCLLSAIFRKRQIETVMVRARQPLPC